MMDDRPMVLRPPAGQGFGGTFTVPPDFPAATLAVLLERGYSVIESDDDRTKTGRDQKRKDRP